MSSPSNVPAIDFTPEDFNRSKVLDQGWYRFRVKAVEYVANKQDATKNNYMFDFVGLEGAAKDVPVTRYFPDSAKARGYLIPFINACAGKQAITEKGGNMNPALCVGKELDLFIKPGEFGGNTKNDVGGCRPVAQPAKAS